MKDFHSGTEGLICQKNCEGWMVGVWEGLNLGSIPNDHMPSQKDPKISIERRCSTILPGKDQEMLVQMNERPLDQPTVIYGLAGTGKTIAIMARIQHVLSKLTETSKAIYLTSEENAIRLVKRQLEVCNIDLTHITLAKFAAFHNLCDINYLCKVIKELISDGYRYIYLDSVEDFGMDWVNKLLEETLTPSSLYPQAQLDPCNLYHKPMDKGDFWITFDPFQGVHDSHFLMKGRENQISWHGNLPEGEFLTKVSRRTGL